VQAKINFEKLEKFQYRKNVRLRTTIRPRSTTISPQKYHHETRTFSKTTLKNTSNAVFSDHCLAEQFF
jgi:hypothetical protein